MLDTQDKPFCLPDGGKQATIFEGMWGTRSKVFRNREALNSNYIPEEILQRDKEIHSIVSRLKPLSVDAEAKDFSIYGLTGVGKTVIARYVVDRLMAYCKEQGLRHLHPLYINCRSTRSEREIMVKVSNSFITDDIKPKLKDFTSKSRAPELGWGIDRHYTFMYKVMNIIGGKFLIILDEAEKIEASARNVLYSLTRETQVGLDNAKCTIILISNDPKFFPELDNQLQSSFGSDKMIVKPYDANQLYQILKQRSDLAFVDGAVDEGILRHISAIASKERGDARYAIEVLRKAAELADEMNTDVNLGLARKAIGELELDEVTEIISSAPLHKKIFLSSLLYCLTNKTVRNSTKHIYAMYSEMCGWLGYDPVSSRWLRVITKELTDCHIISANTHSKGFYGTETHIDLLVNIKTLENMIKKDDALFELKDFKTSLTQRSLDAVKSH